MNKRDVLFIILGVMAGMAIMYFLHSKKIDAEKDRIKKNLQPFLTSDLAQSLGINGDKLMNQIYNQN